VICRQRIKIKSFFLSFFFVLLVSNASAFSIPEKFQYDLALAGINIGSIELEVQDKGQDIQITSRVSSKKWVSLFYEVDDNAVSVLKKGQQKGLIKNFKFIPQTYRIKLNEGENKIYKEFTFDHAKKNITYIDHLNKEKAFYVIRDAIFDPLSSLYYIRQLPLQVGKSVFVTVFNNKLFNKVEIQVLRKETLKTSHGTFSTLVIRTNMNSVGDGIFYKPGDIYIWLTDDNRRIPVLIEKRLTELVHGKLPDYLKDKIPALLKNKLSEGSIRAYLVK